MRNKQARFLHLKIEAQATKPYLPFFPRVLCIVQRFGPQKILEQIKGNSRFLVPGSRNLVRAPLLKKLAEIQL